jgi:hypothetical protein
MEQRVEDRGEGPAQKRGKNLKNVRGRIRRGKERNGLKKDEKRNKETGKIEEGDVGYK